MANLKTKRKKKKIESKYSELIAKLLEEYSERPMSEFWEKCDELKEQMAKEFEEAGIRLENN